MTDKTTSIFQASGLIRNISLSVLMPFFRKMKSARPSQAQITSSVFSQPDESALFAYEEEICPLVEAEVFVIYGRMADADKALHSGIKSGRITADQARQFWADQQAKPPMPRRA